jgi:hypothetical protein
VVNEPRSWLAAKPIVSASAAKAPAAAPAAKPAAAAAPTAKPAAAVVPMARPAAAPEPQSPAQGDAGRPVAASRNNPARTLPQPVIVKADAPSAAEENVVLL